MKKLDCFRTGLLAGTAVALLACSGAFAQDDATASEGPVENLVVTAPKYVPEGGSTGSKLDIPLVETPQSVTVVNRDQIDLLDWQNLDQVVRYTAGAVGENFGPDLRYDWLTVRSFYPIQYVDGLQAPVGSVANIGLDLFGFERVEVLKGPASGLYGTTPPGGIINMISRRPEAEFGGFVSAGMASYNSWKVAGDVTGSVSDNISLRLTGLYTERGTQTDHVDSDRTYIAPAAKIEITPVTTLTLLAYYQDTTINGGGGGFIPAFGVILPNPFGKVPSSRNVGEPDYNVNESEQYGVGYEFKHEFTDTLSFEQNLKYFYAERFALQVYGGGLVDADFNNVPDDYRTVQLYNFPFDETVKSFNVDNRLVAKATTGSLEHLVLLGVDYRDYTNESAFGFAFGPTQDLFAPVYGTPIVTPPITTPYLDQNEKQTGVYLQDQIKLGGLIATLTGRHDWVDTDNAGTTTKVTEFTYRGGLTYLFETGWAPYISYSRSFQPTPGADALTLEPFEPTVGKQTEIGLKYDGSNLSDDIKVFASAAAYQIVQENVLSAGPDVRYAFNTVQVGEVEVQGIELEGVARIRERLSLNGSYTYTDSEVTASSNPAEIGEELNLVPHHKISALVDYTFQEGPLAGLGASFGVRHTSKSNGGTIGGVTNISKFENEAVTLYDGSIHYDYLGWGVSVTGSNLFDEEYVAQCSSLSNCFYGSRANYSLTVTRNF